jgi:hypothetical protein
MHRHRLRLLLLLVGCCAGGGGLRPRVMCGYGRHCWLLRC